MSEGGGMCAHVRDEAKLFFLLLKKKKFDIPVLSSHCHLNVRADSFSNQRHRILAGYVQ